MPFKGHRNALKITVVALVKNLLVSQKPPILRVEKKDTLVGKEWSTWRAQENID